LLRAFKVIPVVQAARLHSFVQASRLHYEIPCYVFPARAFTEDLMAIR
jgi:hypothetical protein